MMKYIPLLLIVLVVGCNGDVDVTPPSMEIVSFVPQPEEASVCGTLEPGVFQLTGGDNLEFDVVFTDDESLSQYKVDIHNNFDCHGHGNGSVNVTVVPNVSNQTTDWTVLDIQDIEGTSAPTVNSLMVPENVTTGNYHFQIQVIDESGNDNPAANFYTLSIKNPLDSESPQIIVQEPMNRDFAASKGESIKFVGQVIDERSLSDGGNGVLYLSYTDLSSGNTFATGMEFPFDETVGLTFDFDFEYEIPQTLVNGNYRFNLGANDGVRNVADFEFFNIEITN